MSRRFNNLPKFNKIVKGLLNLNNIAALHVTKPLPSSEELLQKETFYINGIDDKEAEDMLKDSKINTYIVINMGSGNTFNPCIILKQRGLIKPISYYQIPVKVQKVRRFNELEYKEIGKKEWHSIEQLIKNHVGKNINPIPYNRNSRSAARSATRSRSRSRNAASAPRSRSRSRNATSNLGAWVNGGNRKSRRQTRRKLK